MPMVLDVKNTYRRLDVVDFYATTNELNAGERVLFEKLRPAIAGKAILDIGIGTGRTTPFLASLTEDYTGVDYSPEMVQRAKELHPRANLLECDARDLSRFGPARFDFILFSFNGIDSVSDADRQVILRQILSALKPGGLFAFSAHNLASVRTSAFSLKNLHFTPNPVRFLGAVRYYLQGVLNHLRARHSEVRAPGYALLTERAAHYRSLNYYVSKALQVAQLERAGFTGVEIFTEQGKPTNAQNDDRDRWIHYVARKPA